MAGANFYLKEPKSNSLTGIYLKAWLSGKPFKFYTGEKIQPKEWSAIKQRPKPSYMHYTNVSGLLDRLETAIQKLKLESINSGQGINFDQIREQLARFIDRSEVEEKLSIFQYFDQFLEMKKVSLSFNYLRSAKTLRNHLHEYSKEKKLTLKFEDITLGFYEAFVAYLYGKGLTANTVGTNINRLKYFLDWSNLHGYNKTLDYKSKKFSAIEKPTDLIYLTEEGLE